ncbi:triosephosphate isomerase [Uncinocarpus reesii 1704]|uniref:Triosephosphate isomerase n=1 Tax=Uncinocarpus reesii (strain UAMH 1704) TaxID=336963 RepID=C4JES2_UNCRE|nr:triosephosphate isomerase [Uncinocarpus reesii 1704]EEP77383.1 triosephosphate isomerase [Uncinocarpus reesii 1704]
MSSTSTGPQFPSLPTTLLIISLKMYFTPSRTLEYLQELLNSKNEIVRPQNRSKLLLALIPDFLTLYPCSEAIRRFESSKSSPKEAKLPSSLLLGAQDCFWEASGAYTGEVSPRNLRDINVSIVELGHAERRAIFGETDEQVARKAAAAAREGLVPLVCIGEVSPPEEHLAEASTRAAKECEAQIKPVLEALPDEAPVIFAYEPVWAIGQPKPAGVDHVGAVALGIKDIIKGIGGERRGEVRVLYGGSAGPGLWGAGGLGKVVDGMFLGRFAHEIGGVKSVVREVEESLE